MVVDDAEDFVLEGGFEVALVGDGQHAGVDQAGVVLVDDPFVLDVHARQFVVLVDEVRDEFVDEGGVGGADDQVDEHGGDFFDFFFVEPLGQFLFIEDD